MSTLLLSTLFEIATPDREYRAWTAQDQQSGEWHVWTLSPRHNPSLEGTIVGSQDMARQMVEDYMRPYMPEPVRLTKSALNRFILWTTSRYNEMKKPEVVKEILGAMKQGELRIPIWQAEIQDYRHEVYTRKVYKPGTFCSCSAMTHQFDFVALFDQRIIIKCTVDEYGQIKQEFERIRFPVD